MPSLYRQRIRIEALESAFGPQLTDWRPASALSPYSLLALKYF